MFAAVLFFEPPPDNWHLRKYKNRRIILPGWLFT